MVKWNENNDISQFNLFIRERLAPKLYIKKARKQITINQTTVI